MDSALESNPCFCPWCLHQENRVVDFYFHQPIQEGGLAEADHPLYRKAIPEKPKRGLLQCPECKQKFQRGSLFESNDTLETYVRFILAYPIGERQKRMNWNKVKERLRVMNMASEFWELWYKLKPQYFTPKEV